MFTDALTVPEKVKGKRSRGESMKPSSGLDVDSLLDMGLARKKTKISKDNAIPEFKQTLNRLHAASKDEEIESAVIEMGEIIQSLIKESMGDKNYARAQENLGVMREQCIEFEVPQLYNNILKDLKKQISSGVLGGDRREMWAKYIRWPGNGQLGLITKYQCEASEVNFDEAEKVRTYSQPRILQNLTIKFTVLGEQELSVLFGKGVARPYLSTAARRREESISPPDSLTQRSGGHCARRSRKNKMSCNDFGWASGWLILYGSGNLIAFYPLVSLIKLVSKVRIHFIFRRGRMILRYRRKHGQYKTTLQRGVQEAQSGI